MSIIKFSTPQNKKVQIKKIKMIKKKKLGIWMCQGNFHLIEYNNNEPVDKSNLPKINNDEINSSEPILKFSEVQKAEIFRKQEIFKKLTDSIINYDEIILFGPIDAKKELLNYIETNLSAPLPVIEIKQTELMTEEEQTAFVRNHFLHHNETNA